MPRKAKEGMERRAVLISVPYLSTKLAEIYEKVPTLRGKSPSTLASIAMQRLYEDIKRGGDIYNESPKLLYIFRSEEDNNSARSLNSQLIQENPILDSPNYNKSSKNNNQLVC